MFTKMLSIVFALVIATAFMYANMAKAQIIEEGLVSYWTFDRASIKGKTVKDVWGANDGTTEGAPQIVVGKVGDALEFDGKDDYVNVPSPVDKNENTVEIWFKVNKHTPKQGILETTSAGEVKEHHPYFLLQNDNGTLKIYQEAADYITVSSISTDTWYHFVAVRNSSHEWVYLNGDLKVDRGIDTSGDNSEFHIGVGYDDYFNGLIDEVRIYARVLSKAEISQNYKAKGLAITNPAGKLSLTWGKIKVESP